MFRELITGEGLIENNRRDLLTSAGVGGAAAAVALMLAALGVYGVIAFMRNGPWGSRLSRLG